MTQQEWEAATEQERYDEIERCKNPCYVYNTYWVDQNGNKPRLVTQEEWDERMKYFNTNQHQSKLESYIEENNLRYFMESDSSMYTMYIGKFGWNNNQVKENGWCVKHIDEDKIWEYALYTLLSTAHLLK